MEPRPLPLEMREEVQVRAVKVFGIGPRLIEVGEIVTVSRSRAEYLTFLGVVERVL